MIVISKMPRVDVLYMNFLSFFLFFYLSDAWFGLTHTWTSSEHFTNTGLFMIQFEDEAAVMLMEEPKLYWNDK